MAIQLSISPEGRVNLCAHCVVTGDFDRLRRPGSWRLSWLSGDVDKKEPLTTMIKRRYAIVSKASVPGLKHVCQNLP